MLSQMLVLGVFFAVVDAAGAAADPAASHAARVALTALAEVDASEAALLEEEQEKVTSGQLTPLQAGESLHDSLIPHLEGAVFALRHALAAGVLVEEADLAECAALDIQLNDLRSAQTTEPLFFWHGPRRLVLPRLRRLLTSVQGELHALAEEAADATADLRELLGKAPSESASDSVVQSPKVLSHGVPAVCVFVGEFACGQGKCDIESVLAKADTDKSTALLALLAKADTTKPNALRGQGSGVHLMIEHSSVPILKRIGGALRASKAPAPWLSLILLPEHLSSKSLTTVVNKALQALGRRSVNLLWVPAGILAGRVWKHFKSELETLLRSGTIGGYGVQAAEVQSESHFRQIFVGRQPAPVAWLTPHDFLVPALQAVALAALKLGIAVVAETSPPQAAALNYLEVAVGRDRLAQQEVSYQWKLQAMWYHWIMKQGVGFTIDLGADDTPSVLQNLKQLRVSDSAMRLLDVAQDFLRTDEVTVEDRDQSPLEEPVPKGLQQRLQYFRRAAAYAASSSRGSLEGAADSASAGELVPGVSPAVMQTLDYQASRYKENNHVIYTEDFFDEATFAAILAEVDRLWKSDDIEGNCNLDGKNRLGGYVLDHTSQDSSLYKLIYGNEQFRRWVSAVNGMGPMWPSDFPIEIREYGPESAGMGCHSDLQMYADDVRDCEFAVTIINDSKCNVTFYDSHGVKHEVHTRGNSVMMVRANAARHCVSLTAGGSRTILKFIYVGNYRKSRGFSSYKVNQCGPSNYNNAKLRHRRETLLGLQEL